MNAAYDAIDAGHAVTVGLAADAWSYGGWQLYADSTSFDVTTAVPEPSQLAASILLVGGIAGFVIVRRRKALIS